jgi:cystathionine gamma-synthase
VSERESEEPAPPDPVARRFRPLPPWVGPGTRLVHSGDRPDLNAGAVVPPIYQTSTFHYPEAFSEAKGFGETYLYSRMRNPTVEGPEEVLREIEGGESARLFASGMGAITATVLSLVKPGDRVVALADLYGGTVGLVKEMLPRFGVRAEMVGPAESRDPERALAGGARLVLLETPTNPVLRVHDLARWAAASHRSGALLVVDNTFASPINQHPLALGADLVVHSATKYLGGHSDLLAGAVVGARGLVDQIDAQHYLGAPLDPFAAFLLHRSLRTLALRVARHNENGRRVAEALAHHPAVARIHYPGWASAEEEAIASRQMRGRGGVLALSLRGGAPAVDRFLRGLRLVHVAASLGGVESLASVPRDTSHTHFTPEELAACGIDPGLVRISLGIEEPDDLVRDLSEALDAVEPSKPLPSR